MVVNDWFDTITINQLKNVNHSFTLVKVEMETTSYQQQNVNAHAEMVSIFLFFLK